MYIIPNFLSSSIRFPLLTGGWNEVSGDEHTLWVVLINTNIGRGSKDRCGIRLLSHPILGRSL